MAHAASSVTKEVKVQRSGFSFMTLALWRLRPTWFLLLMTGVGIVAAVTIACVIPLLSDVMVTAAAHDVLKATPDTSVITLDTSTVGISSQVIHSVERQLSPYFQHTIGPYLSPTVPLSIQSTGYTLPTLHLPSGSAYELRLYSTAMAQAATHLQLLQGRLPHENANNNGEIETLLTPSVAQSLHATIGSLLPLQLQYAASEEGIYAKNIPTATLSLRVVGLFEVRATNISYWQGNDFQTVKENQWSSFTLLLPNTALLAALDHLVVSSHSNAIFLTRTFELTWHYSLNVSHISSDQIADLTNQLNNLQAKFLNVFANTQNQGQPLNNPPYPFLTQASVYNPLPNSFDVSNSLAAYLNRVDVFRIPGTMLVLLIIGLIFLFVGLMADLLAGYQAEAIALLRSRGASAGQVTASLMVQVIALSVIALGVGVPLAIFIVFALASSVLSPASRDALNLITDAPLQTVLNVGWYGTVTVLVVIVVIGLLLRGVVNTNVLTLRRATARSGRGSMWQRMGLDVAAVVIALTGFGIYSYVANTGSQLGISEKTLFSAPLIIVAATFLIIGCMILFLRYFPVFLRLCTWFAMRGRGASAMLALAQMARTPRYYVRMTLLLALTTAFASFTLVFSATQGQRAADISAYETGADFNGDIPVGRQLGIVANMTAQYRQIPGVLSATVGYVAEGEDVGVTPPVPLKIKAVDAATFAQTGLWNTQDSTQSLSSLMTLLLKKKAVATSMGAVPVIVDAVTAQKDALNVGNLLTIDISALAYGSLDCQVVAIIQHIPTVNDSLNATGAADTSLAGGMLLDYGTYAQVYREAIRISGLNVSPLLPLNHVWLRTRTDGAALTQVRAALQTPALRLDNLFDRYALRDTLSRDPLYLNLLMMLSLGAFTALVLAVIGDILASWLSVRTRLTQFALLRAQGAGPRQIINVLLWEQGIVYLTSLLLGAIFGGILAVTVVPILVFTSIPANGVLSTLSNGEFYVLQQTIPTSIILPFTLYLAFAILVGIFILALVVMARVALQPSMSQVLRLDED